MLNKEMAEFHLTDTATHIHNWVRGMNPWPGAWFSTSGGKKLKVMSCRVATAHGEAPGTVLGTKPLTVACSEGAIQLLEVCLLYTSQGRPRKAACQICSA